jgi:plasmid stabilization system protein ParE
MALDIKWSPKALHRFHDVVKYLENNWGESVVKDFVQRTDLLLKNLIIHPKIHRSITNKYNIKEAVVTKHNLLIYKITKDKIILLTFFDTRQHPKNSFENLKV